MNPETLYEKEINLLIFFFSIIIEDRRPDLKEYEYHSKYKTQIQLRVFFTKYSFIFHSPGRGSWFKNGKDIVSYEEKKDDSK